MALMIMGSSGGCCGRSGSALPDITMHAGAGARGASSVSATNIEIGRAAASAAPGRGDADAQVGARTSTCAKKKSENGPTLLKR